MEFSVPNSSLGARGRQNTSLDEIMPDHISTRPFYKKKRCWALAVILTPVLVVAIMWLSGQRELNLQLAELRAAGLPTNGEELNEFYKVPDGTDDTTVVWQHAVEMVTAADIYARGKDIPIIGDKPRSIPAIGEDWPELAATRTFLSELTEEFAAIRTAVDAGGAVRFPVDFSEGLSTELKHTHEMRGIARLLQLSAHVNAHDGNTQQSLDDILALFTASNALQVEPSMISHLTRIAIHVIGCRTVEQLMSHSGWNEIQLTTLQQAVQTADFRHGCENALCGERAISLMMMQNAQPLVPLRQSGRMEILRMFRKSIERLSGSWTDAIDQEREATVELRKRGKGTISLMYLLPVKLAWPSPEYAMIGSARAEARQECISAVIAAERYRLKHGAFPETLTDIEPLLFGPGPKSAESRLIDPFSNQPLRYQLSDSQLLIYSVGDNRQDDGGACHAERAQDILDLGFRLER